MRNIGSRHGQVLAQKDRAQTAMIDTAVTIGRYSPVRPLPELASADSSGDCRLSVAVIKR